MVSLQHPVCVRSITFAISPPTGGLAEDNDEANDGGEDERSTVSVTIDEHDYADAAHRLASAHPEVPLLVTIHGDANDEMTFHLSFLSGGDAPAVRVSHTTAAVPLLSTDGSQVPEVAGSPAMEPSVHVHEMVAGGLDVTPLGGDLMQAPGPWPSVVVRIANQTTALCGRPAWGERHAVCDEWHRLVSVDPVTAAKPLREMTRARDMTLERCALFCRGFLLFKVQDAGLDGSGQPLGQRCGCLDTWPYQESAAAVGAFSNYELADCTMPCAANSAQLCGGPQARPPDADVAEYIASAPPSQCGAGYTRKMSGDCLGFGSEFGSRLDLSPQECAQLCDAIPQCTGYEAQVVQPMLCSINTCTDWADHDWGEINEGRWLLCIKEPKPPSVPPSVPPPLPPSPPPLPPGTVTNSTFALASLYWNPLSSGGTWNTSACTFEPSHALTPRVSAWTTFAWPNGTIEVQGVQLRPANPSGNMAENMTDASFAATLPELTLDEYEFGGQRAAHCKVLEANDSYVLAAAPPLRVAGPTMLRVRVKGRGYALVGDGEESATAQVIIGLGVHNVSVVTCGCVA